MSTQKLSNISLSEFRAFLDLCQCKEIRTKGGHEIWTRSDLTRPITFQSHIEPVPEFIIKNILRTLGYSKNEYFSILKNEKEVFKSGNSYSLR